MNIINLSLTLNCNNHCHYCFQKQLKNDDSTISNENLEKFLKYVNKDLKILNILGGEVTILTDLIEKMNLIRKYLPFTTIYIITNLLGLKENIEFLSKSNYTRFLINSTYDLDKEEIFFSNLNLLLQNNIEENIAFSLTLSENKELNKFYIDRIYSILKKYPKINKIRLGFKCPVPGEKINLITNYDNDIKYLLDKWPKNIRINFDCAINLCQISYNLLQKIKSNNNIINLTEECISMPFDIDPKLTVRYCYSSVGEKFIKKSILDYTSLNEIGKELEQNNFNYKIKNTKCINCDYFKKNLCHPCHSLDQALLLSNSMEL